MKKIVIIFLALFSTNLCSGQAEPEFYNLFSKAFITSAYADTVARADIITISYYPDSMMNKKEVLSKLVYTKDWALKWYLGYVGYSDNLIGKTHIGPGYDTISEPYLQQVDWSSDGKLLGFRYYEHNEFLFFQKESSELRLSYINDDDYDVKIFSFNSNGEKIFEFVRKDSIGMITYFYSDNSIKEEISLFFTKQGNNTYTNGSYKCYHKNGNLFVDGHYKYDEKIINGGFFNQSMLKDSVWTYYDEKGRIMKSELYVQGAPPVDLVFKKNKYKKFIKTHGNPGYHIFTGIYKLEKRHVSFNIVR
jgi:hypothetical protein